MEVVKIAFGIILALILIPLGSCLACGSCTTGAIMTASDRETNPMDGDVNPNMDSLKGIQTEDDKG